MNELISIIVPVYKVEKYLNRCIDSILNQTYTNFECILVDDGSPDNCPTICDEYAKIDSRIKVIHKSNGGLSSARNAGLDICQGEYICFIDSDDWVSPLYLEKLYINLKKSHAQIAICETLSIDSDGKIIDKTYLNDVILSLNQIFLELVNSNAFVYNIVCNKLFKKDIFKKIRFTTGKLYEDFIIIHSIYACCSSIVTIHQGLYFYVHRYDSITHQTKKIKNYVDHIYGYIDRIKVFNQLNYNYLNKNNYNGCWHDYELLLKNSSYEDFKNVYPAIKKDIRKIAMIIICLYEKKIRGKIYIFIITFFPKFGKNLFMKEKCYE